MKSEGDHCISATAAKLFRDLEQLLNFRDRQELDELLRNRRFFYLFGRVLFDQLQVEDIAESGEDAIAISFDCRGRNFRGARVFPSLNI